MVSPGRLWSGPCGTGEPGWCLGTGSEDVLRATTSMDDYPEHLAPEFEESGAVKTPFKQWWARVQPSFPDVPENVAEQCCIVTGGIHLTNGFVRKTIASLLGTGTLAAWQRFGLDGATGTMTIVSNTENT